MKGALIMKKFALVALIAGRLCPPSLSTFQAPPSPRTAKDVDGKTIAMLADQSGGEVLFSAEAEPSPERLSALGSIVAEIRSWTDLQAAEIRAVNTQDQLQVTAIPKSLS